MVKVGDRVSVVTDKGSVVGTGEVTYIAERTEVLFDNGSGGMFPNDFIKPVKSIFKEWFNKRISEDMNNQQNQSNQTNQPSQVTAPTDPKEIARRAAVQKFTTDMMKTNRQLLPGKTDQKVVASAMASNPQLAKMDTNTQQDISNFFIKQ